MIDKVNEAHFKKLAKQFSILYVTCEKAELLEVLQGYFKEVFVVESASKALGIYHTKSVDIVFIDADTKELSWLLLVKDLRKILYDMPIAIITEMNNADRLTTAITVGITQCIFKPVDMKRLSLVIFDMVNKLQNKLDAKELFYKKEQDKFNKIVCQTADDIIKKVPVPMFVFKEDVVLFANHELYKLFEAKKIEIEEIQHLKEITSLFDNCSKELDFQDLSLGKSLDKQYQYKDYSLKKVFIPNKFSVEMEGFGTCYVVVFSDIAPFLMQIKMMRYQTHKSENYKALIEALLAKQLFTQTSESIPKYVTAHTSSLDTKLSDKELQVLRKSTISRISAKEYVQDLDQTAYADVCELDTIEEDLQMAIDTFSMESSRAHLFEIARLFHLHGEVINALIEFLDLGNSVCSLSDFLYGLSDEELSEYASTVAMQCENVLGDLTQWRLNIFETQVAQDIHYLDSSIFSSILQLQLNLGESEDDGGDLELFKGEQ